MTRRPLLFLRALTLRCPNCGKRKLFSSWFTMKPKCPGCWMSLQAGNRVGANLLNLVVAEVVVVLLVAVVAMRTWPNPPWAILQWSLPLAAILLPLLFYPFSKLIFVAIDLAMYPDAAPDSLAHELVMNPKKDEK